MKKLYYLVRAQTGRPPCLYMFHDDIWWHWDRICGTSEPFAWWEVGNGIKSTIVNDAYSKKINVKQLEFYKAIL